MGKTRWVDNKRTSRPNWNPSTGQDKFTPSPHPPSPEGLMVTRPHALRWTSSRSSQSSWCNRPSHPTEALTPEGPSPEAGKDPAGHQGLNPSQGPRGQNEDPRLRSPSVFLGTSGSKPDSHGWLTNPKNKKRPQGRCQVSSTK